LHPGGRENYTSKERWATKYWLWDLICMTPNYPCIRCRPHAQHGATVPPRLARAVSQGYIPRGSADRRFAPRFEKAQRLRPQNRTFLTRFAPGLNATQARHQTLGAVHTKTGLRPTPAEKVGISGAKRAVAIAQHGKDTVFPEADNVRESTAGQRGRPQSGRHQVQGLEEVVASLHKGGGRGIYRWATRRRRVA
jgi:hypothetical protein